MRSTTSVRLAALILIVLGATGCHDSLSSDDALAESRSLEMSSAYLSTSIGPETAGARDAVDFLNRADVTIDLLTLDAGISADAAQNLLAQRPLGSLLDVDRALPMRDAEQLLVWLLTNGWVSERDLVVGIFSSIPFTVRDAERTLTLVNNATLEFFVVELGLPTPFVRDIVTGRNYTNISQVASIDGATAANLATLRIFASAYVD
jgi:hypothetical protein